MPYPNEHAARLRDPDSLSPVRVRRTAGSGDGTVNGVKVPESIDVIWYVIRRDGEEVPVAQALRFPVDSWSEAEARAWLKDHDIKPIAFEPAGEAASLTAFAPDGSMIPVGPEEEHDDIVTQRFRKELFRAGAWEYSDGSGFNVESDRLNLMYSETMRLINNGTRIPLSDGPVPHEDVDNPHNSIGDLEFVTLEGDSIFGIVEIVGKDKIENALANDVSIFAPPEYKDSKGEMYITPITHVAVTPKPLISGLSDWQKIAASLKKEGKKGHSFKGGSIMWKKIAKALGLSDESLEKITDENGADKVLAAIKDMKAAHKKEIDDLKAAHKEDVDKEKKATKEVKASLDALSGDKPVDDTMVALVADNRRMKLDALVAASRITPELRKRIDERFGEKEAIAASMKAGRNGEEFDFMVELLKDNDPVVLAEQTGAQVVKASLTKTASEDKGAEALLKNAEARAEAAKK